MFHTTDDKGSTDPIIELRIPEVKRLAMRIDTEFFKIVDGGKLRITL